MKLNWGDYRSKVLGCWMGKNIGGTLGMPFEWRRQVNDVTFYTQELTGNLPNDDLDIQLLWLVAMEEQARKNMAVFRQALTMFNPFGINVDGASAPAAGEEGEAAGAKQRSDVDDLKRQLEALNKRIDKLSGES